MCVCVCMHVFVHMCMRVRMCTWRGQRSPPSVLLFTVFCALFFEARSLLEPRAHQFSQPGEPVDSSAVMPGFCLIQTQTLMLAMAGLPIKCLISVFVLTVADIVR